MTSRTFSFSLLSKLLATIAFVALLAAAFVSLAAESRTLSTVVVILSVILGLAGLTSLLISDGAKTREIDASVRLARGLANGEAIRDSGDGELQQSLKAISDYIAANAQIAIEIAASGTARSVPLRSEADMLGTAFATLNESLRSTLGTKASRDLLQRSIVTLLNEVSAVAAGDLTVRAEVGPEVTGEIAAAFNKMTTSLYSLIRQVKDVTLQISASAASINQTTEQLAEGSIAQASQISRTTAAISQMTQQIQGILDAAIESSKVAADALRSAQNGIKASDDNIHSLTSIRNRVQETAKRIKKLGERAQEIGQITELIDDLSDRTGLLALNASLRAAADSNETKGFGLVAEEVERLAEQSNRLTMQISHLTQTINLETKEVLASMEETIQEVITGSSLADKAGRSLTELKRTAQQLSELVKKISSSSDISVRTSTDIANAMSGISEVTALVRSGSKRAAASVRSLVELSQELRNAIAPFKLPAEANRMPANTDNPRNEMLY